MANRRISELPSIQGASLAEQDLLTLVRVFEVDPTLKNKKITLGEFGNYFSTRYLAFSGGTLTGPVIVTSSFTVSGNTGLNTLTATGNATFNSVFIQNNLNVTGTLSGNTITGVSVNATNGTFQDLTTSGNTVQGNLLTQGNAFFSSGVTVTGTLTGSTVTGGTVNFQSGTFTSQVSGTLVTGNTVNATSITGVSGVFTSQVSGATVTGDIGRFSSITGVSGVFTSQVSGATVTGNIGRFSSLTGNTANFTTASSVTFTGTSVNATSGVFQFLAAINQSFGGNLTFSGDTFTLGSGYFSSGISVTGTVSGSTITGNTGRFTNITGSTLTITTPSGGSPAVICSGVVSGGTSGFIIQGPLIILP